MKAFFFDIETAPLDPDSDIKQSLSPFHAKIVAIGLLQLNAKKPIIFSEAGSNENTLITDFWGSLKDGEMLIGFNSAGFDNRFLFIRSLHHQIQPKRIHTKDLRTVLAFGEGYRAKGTMTEFCGLFGFENCDEYSGKDVPKLYHSGKLHLVEEHLEHDLFKLQQLFFFLSHHSNLLDETLERCKDA